MLGNILCTNTLFSEPWSVVHLELVKCHILVCGLGWELKKLSLRNYYVTTRFAIWARNCHADFSSNSKGRGIGEGEAMILIRLILYKNKRCKPTEQGWTCICSSSFIKILRLFMFVSNMFMNSWTIHEQT